MPYAVITFFKHLLAVEEEANATLEAQAQKDESEI